MGDVTSEGTRRRRRTTIRKERRRGSNKAKWNENSDPAETAIGKRWVFRGLNLHPLSNFDATFVFVNHIFSRI